MNDTDQPGQNPGGSPQGWSPNPPTGGQDPEQYGWAAPPPDQQAPQWSGQGAGTPAGGAVPPGTPPAPGYSSAGSQYPGLDTQPPKSRKKLFIGLGVGCGVLVLIIAIIITFVIVNTIRSEQAAEEARKAQEAQEAQAEQEWLEGMAAPVESYLQGLADGDAEAAIAAFDPEVLPEPSPLMTDDVLAASQEANPIEDIEVPVPESSPEGGYYVVPATFTIGGEAVDVDFEITGPDDPEDDGSAFAISSVPGELSVPDGFDGVGLTVNGAEVEAGSHPAFIGTYAAKIGNEMFTLDGETTAVVQPNDYASIDAQIGLSDKGTKTFKKLVKDELDTCLASKKLDTGCGLKLSATLSDGTKLKDGTLDRSLEKEAKKNLEKMEPELDPLNATVARSDQYIGSVDVTADCTKDGRSGECEVIFGPTIERPTVDLTAKDPKVEW